MKIRIDKDGYLWLERAGVMKAQVCPHGLVTNEAWNGSQFVADNGFRCGDWCPLFGEPSRNVWNAVFGGSEFTYEHQLCQTRIVVESPDFTDERGVK